MEPVEGARTFRTSGAAYDAFMGRYSTALAPAFADLLGAGHGRRALDVGCGPGALTGVLVSRLGASAVCACDPTPGFVEECLARHPGVEVRQGRAEAIPFPDQSFDLAAAQLVFHFVSDPAGAVSELLRVVRPEGTIGSCVWDFEDGMQMLRLFWDAALALDSDAPDEARVLRFSRPGELVELFDDAGLGDVAESTLEVRTTYDDFDELWAGFMAGIGPAGAYCTGLPSDRRDQLRTSYFDRLGRPVGPFTLSALARCATGTNPAVRAN